MMRVLCPTLYLCICAFLCFHQLRSAGIVDVAGDAAVLDSRNSLIVDILPSLSRWLPLTRAPEKNGVLRKGVDYSASPSLRAVAERRSFCKTLMSDP